jgi:hypothetical protein
MCLKLRPVDDAGSDRAAVDLLHFAKYIFTATNQVCVQITAVGWLIWTYSDSWDGQMHAAYPYTTQA